MRRPLVFRNVSRSYLQNLLDSLLSRNIHVSKVSSNDMQSIYKVPEFEVTITYYTTTNTLLIQGGEDGLAQIQKFLEKEVKSLGALLKSADVSDLQLSGKFIVGIDESGAGETFGPLSIVAVLITKKGLLELGQSLPRKISSLRKERINKLFHEVKKRCKIYYQMVSPSEIDESDIKIIEDSVIKRFLQNILERLKPSSISVVIDDYGPKDLRSFLLRLEKEGAEIIITPRADEKYISVRAASIVARKFRLDELDKINTLWKIKDDSGNMVTPGTGSPSNPSTEHWLITYRKKFPYSEFPDFVRKSWRNVQNIEKKYPRKNYEIICPYCGTEIKKLKGAIIGQELILICPYCKEVLQPSDISFRDIPIIPDTSALIARLITKDLKSRKYFEGAIFLLPLEIYNADLEGKRRDRKIGFARELESIANYEKQGVLRKSRLIVSIASEDKYARDIELIKLAMNYKAILLTRDRTLAAEAQKYIFTIFCL